MNLSLAIALRYVRPRRFTFIGIIGLISVVGIIIGTAALIIVMSLFNGFRDLAQDMMTGFGPHVRVYGAPPDASVHATPVNLAKLVVQTPTRTGVASAIGMPIADTSAWGPVRRATMVGSADVGDGNGIVVGAGLAESLNLYLGDTVTLIAPSQIESALTMMSMPVGHAAVVRGFFQSNTNREVDASTVYLGSDAMRSILGVTEPTAYDVRLPDPRMADDVARTWAASGIRVETWMDMHRGMYDTMRLERAGSFIVLTLILLVAVFNIVVSLTLGVAEKRRDIAVLKTIGCTDAQVRNIFLAQGLTIGVVSVVLGILIGVGTCVGQQTFHWIRFDMSQGYLVPALPVAVHAADVALVAAVALVFSASAAIYPARRAAATRPADGLRSE
jgi:lipoprotein-releasing system permease protein